MSAKTVKSQPLLGIREMGYVCFLYPVKRTIRLAALYKGVLGDIKVCFKTKPGCGSIRVRIAESTGLRAHWQSQLSTAKACVRLGETA